MIAVSNTSPLCYLILIGQDSLLEQIFETVFIPPAVHQELTHSGAPELVRERILASPPWLKACPMQEAADYGALRKLHDGEREAIMLAEALRADFLLLDDQKGREEALKRNLSISGTLGLIELGDKKGLVRNLPETLGQLLATGFFASDSIIREMLQRHFDRNPGRR